MPTCYYVLFSSYSMLSRRMYDVVMGMQCLKLNLFYYILETDKHHCCVLKKTVAFAFSEVWSLITEWFGDDVDVDDDDVDDDDGGGDDDDDDDDEDDDGGGDDDDDDDDGDDGDGDDDDDDGGDDVVDDDDDDDDDDDYYDDADQELPTTETIIQSGPFRS